MSNSYSKRNGNQEGRQKIKMVLSNYFGSNEPIDDIRSCFSVANEEDAEDIRQEVYLKIFKNIDKVIDKFLIFLGVDEKIKSMTYDQIINNPKIKAYLRRCLKNMAIDLKKKRTNTYDFDKTVTVPNIEPDYVHFIDKKGYRKVIDEEVQFLKKKYSKKGDVTHFVFLYIVKGYSKSEIMCRLKIKEESYKHAQRRLRRLYKNSRNHINNELKELVINQLSNRK